MTSFFTKAKDAVFHQFELDSNNSNFTNSNSSSSWGFGSLFGSSSNSSDSSSASSFSLVSFIFRFIIIFIAFVIVFQTCVWVLGKLLMPSKNPKLITGTVDAKHMLIFSQDPSLSNSKTIERSSNQDKGIEFTWSVWVYIDDMTYNSGKYKCVFYKGNEYDKSPDGKDNGINYPNNAPGLYIAPNTNNLVVMMNTFEVINEKIIIEGVPLNKWINVIIRCENKTLDVYLNGTIAKSYQLQGVPKQNYGDVYVAPNGGFSGYISNLWYYSYALGVNEIMSLVKKGANTTMTGSYDALSLVDPNYLSLRYYWGLAAN
jgi:hypothetical protein